MASAYFAFVPSVDWKLGGNHRGAASVAFLEDFQKIVTGGGVERLQAPIIENEQIGAAQEIGIVEIPRILGR